MENLSRGSENSVVKRALVAVQTMRAKLQSLEESRTEPLAIVGMGCRFPGGAENVDAYWRLLSEGRDGISEVPAERWDTDRFYDPDPTVAGKMNTRHGGFLSSPIDAFDAAFFGISPREAEHMDPQQRLLLEVTWEALERAGIPAASLRGSRTGVFVGVTSHSADYWLRFVDPDRIGTFSGTGTSHSVLPGRLSYLLDLEGPSLAIDTACSSSLVAAHYACRSLRLGESDLAIVGGVNLMLAPHFTVAMSRLGLMAGDGRCKTFDARADGYVRGEGCGVVLLKRLSDAERDGDPILALIRGSAVVQDGRTNGISAPNGLSQQKVLRAALAEADLEAADISYIEAHGTGTSLGDPIEIEALAEVYGEPCPDARPCTVGAVKSNIGHLEGAAGIAGLIKVALALQHQKIPQNLHFENLNPHIRLDGTRLQIAGQPRPWGPEEGRRRAGVSSFGWSGTNAHLIVEEAPQPDRQDAEAQLRQEASSAGFSTAADVASPAVPEGWDRPHLLPISARHPAALERLAQSWLELLSSDEAAPRDLAASASLRRDHHEHRLAVIGGSATEWRRGLEAYLAGRKHPALVTGEAREVEPRPVLVFSGQGCQWPGMGRELLATEAVFRRSFEKIDAAFERLAGWSLIAELQAPEERSRLAETEVAQPAIFALQVALSELLQSWGVEPAAVVGHSVGEIAAAHVAGVLSLEDAVTVVYHRSRLMQRRSGLGRMAMVELTPEAAAQAIAGEPRVSIAAVNAPAATVLAGETEALEKVVRRLEEDGVTCRWLRVEYAFHSPQMDPILDELEASLKSLAPRQAVLPFYSTVLAQRLEGDELDASYWRRNVRQPVLFADALAEILRGEVDALLEVGAHPVLNMNLEDGCRTADKAVPVLASLRRDEPQRASLLCAIAGLYTSGLEVRWSEMVEPGAGFVPLPTYPWQRQSFWLPDPAAAAGTTAHRQRGGHPLLGLHQPLAERDLHLWELDLDATTAPYLLDHRVQGLVVLPAAASCEIAAVAAGQARGEESHDERIRLEELRFEQPLMISEAVRRLQVTLESEMADSAVFTFSSRVDGETAWTRHARARVCSGGETRAAEHVDLPALRRRASRQLTGAEHAAAMARRGLDYGAAFQAVQRAWLGDRCAVAELSLAAAARDQHAAYRVHPTLLDAGFQLLAALLPEERAGLFLPIAIDSLECWGAVGESCHAVVELHASDERRVRGDVRLTDAAGRLLVEARGLELQSLDRALAAESETHLYWQLAWRQLEPLASTSAAPQGRWLIFGDHGEGSLGRRLSKVFDQIGASATVVAAGSEFGRDGEDWTVRASKKEDFDRLLQQEASAVGAIYLWPADAPIVFPSEGNTELQTAAEPLLAGALHLAQALAERPQPPRLWLVTRGAQQHVGSGPGSAGSIEQVAQATLLGLGRVLGQEAPALECRLIDLDPRDTADEAQLAALGRELAAADGESEIALRVAEGRIERWSPRLQHRAEPEAPTELGVSRSARAGRDAFSLQVTQPGSFDQLHLGAGARRRPRSGEVEIEVIAAGLNFSDVMKVLGTYPGLPGGEVPIGIECAGRVSAIGDGVQGLAVGDEVIALGVSTFASFVIADARLVVPKPRGLSFEDAATLPVTYATAAYALHHLGRLRAGERVLIHSAAGGVGLAAVALARAAGAEIYATAGSEEKRRYLRSLGIEHVMDSRSLAFVEEVRTATGGEGVDVILNSLIGEAIPRGLGLLRPLGRFLEIGKRDIYRESRLSLAPFRDNLSFFAIDLDRICRQQPAILGEVLGGLLPRFESGELRPLPRRDFAIDDAQSAFRTLAQGLHIGKLVLQVGGREVQVVPERDSSRRLSPDATYLVTGGLGALGLRVAERLAALGARHLVLAGRRGKAEGEALAFLAALQRQGVEVQVATLDVADGDAVAELVERLEATLPPLRGVVHAAGVLDDALIGDLSPERFRKVLSPKLCGALNLHRALAGRELDFLVLFSSAAAVLGAAGQANYAAANAFLDAFATWRTASGRPTLSIAWGPWADAGMAAGRGAELARRGLGSLSVEQGLEAFERALFACDDAWLAVMALDAARWQGRQGAAVRSSLLGGLSTGEVLAAGAAESRSLVDAWRALEPSAARQQVVRHLCEQLAQVMGWQPTQIELDEPLGTMGVGSLQSTEFRNSLESTLGLTLPSTLIWRFPTVTAIAEHVAHELGLERLEESLGEAAEETEEIDLSAVSDDEFDDLLARELATIEELTQ